MEVLYPIQKADTRRAARILADAFQNDPIWSAICEGESNIDKRLRAIFEIPLRQSLAYGEAVAMSPGLEGIVAWIPGAHLDLGLWQLIRIGGLSAATRMGGRVAKKAGDAFKPVTEYRNQHFAGMDFLYLLVLGVPDRHRGKGYGGQLVRLQSKTRSRWTCLCMSEREAKTTYRCTSTSGSRWSRESIFR